jgi:hypothetical protein
MALIPPFFPTLRSSCIFINTSEHKNVRVLCACGVVIVLGLATKNVYGTVGTLVSCPLNSGDCGCSFFA